MLDRSPDQNRLISPEEYYSNAFSITPTIGQSAFYNLAMTAATPQVLSSAMQNHLSQNPESQAILNAYSAASQVSDNPNMGYFQKGVNFVAGAVGMALNPLTWISGEAGGVVASAAVRGAARVAPDAARVFMNRPLNELLGQKVSSYLPGLAGKAGEQPLSSALLTEKTLKAFGSLSGAAVPQSIADNYNMQNDTISWGGVARESGEMGGFGLAIGSIPFAWGLLRGKVNNGLARETGAGVGKPELDMALSKGVITPDEHQWYLDYLSHDYKDPKKTAELTKRASEVVNNNGQVANSASHEVPFDILKPTDMHNLQGVISDQLAADMPDEIKTALSDYVIHNRLDEIRQDPKALDGLRGYVDYIAPKLDKREAKLVEADAIADAHLNRNLKESEPLAQKDLMRAMKKSGIEEQHFKHLPLTIPDNIKRFYKQRNEINKIQEVNKKLFKEYENTGNQDHVEKMKANNHKIEELESKLPKILTPREELQQLRSTLLSKEITPKVLHSADYQRLSELAQVWHNARTLLDRVNVEHEYNRQAAFSALAKQVLSVADSDLPRIANPENVTNYLKARIESKLHDVEKIEQVKVSLEDEQKIPSNMDEVLKAQQERTDQTASKEAKEEFEKSFEKVNEFKGKGNIFKALLQCVSGSLNG